MNLHAPRANLFDDNGRLIIAQFGGPTWQATDGSVEYRWTFTGTSAESGKSVRVPGYEEWTIAPNGLIAQSRGYYDQAEYDRQLQHGIDQTT